MNTSVDTAIAALAASQQTVFSWAQARDRGATQRLADRRLAAGRWLRHAPGVYGLPGSPPSFLRDLWVAHLAVGPVSVVSHEAAAALHRLTGFPRRPVTLTAPHGSHPRVAGAVVHQLRDVRPRQLTTLEGLPVTTASRTFVDLAAVTRKGRLEVALDDAVASRLVTVPEVGRCLASVAQRGKPGVKLLSTLLDARGPGYVPPASRLERALFELLADAGEPAPRRQFAFPGRVPGEGRVDAAYVEARLIIEVDGRRWHTRVADFARAGSATTRPPAPAGRPSACCTRTWWTRRGRPPSSSARRGSAELEAMTHRNGGSLPPVRVRDRPPGGRRPRCRGRRPRRGWAARWAGR